MVSTIKHSEDFKQSLQQYGLNPRDWLCIQTSIDEDSYLIRSIEDPNTILFGRTSPNSMQFQDLQLLSL